MFVAFDRDGLHVDARGCQIFVIERGLGFDEIAGVFKNDPRVGVPRLMNVHARHPRLCCILLEIIGEGARSQRRFNGLPLG